jgi:hypothetical protein
MITLHIENQVVDYDIWKAAFDKYDQARRDRAVVAYRVGQDADDPHFVQVDLDFETREQAAAYVEFLEKIWRTPQSRAAATHGTARIGYLREQHQLR